MPFSQVVDKYNKDANYYGNRAACYLQIKKYSKALEDCDRALELDGSNLKFQRRRGLALMNLGQLTEAQTIFSRLIQSDCSD